MLRHRRFREEESSPEEIFNDTQKQVADDLKKLSQMSMADYVEEEDPELNDDFLTDGLSDAEQFESDELPMSESKKNRILKKAFREAFMLKDVVHQYFDDTGKDEETFDFDEFYNNYIPQDHRYGKYPKQLEIDLKKYFPNMKNVNRLANAGKVGGESKKNDPLYTSSADFDVSDTTQKFADLYKDARVGTLMDAATSCEEKYDKIYDTARSIIMGRATLPHAFIAGDAGIGKCNFFHTPLSIQVEDSIAEEIELWQKSRS